MKKNREPDENQVMKADEFMGMLDVSPNTFKKLVAEGRVPRPLPLGTRSRRWSRSVVMDFLTKPDDRNTHTNTH